MAIEPLRFNRRWVRGNNVTTDDFDELMNKTAAWSARVDQNLKQLGLDIGGATYEFNNTGRAVFATNISAQIANIAVVQNIGLDVSDTSIVKLVSQDGTDLSASNNATVFFNSSSTAGIVISRSIEANISLDITSAHFGFDSSGNQTDIPLWLYLIDTGSTVILGVSTQGGRAVVDNADMETSAGSCTSREKVMVNTDPGAGTYNAVIIGYVLANFDDSSNDWAIQTGDGDINILMPQSHTGRFEGTVVF